jgi:hypothetical protein
MPPALDRGASPDFSHGLDAHTAACLLDRVLGREEE